MLLSREFWELSAAVAIALGFPFALAVFIWEQRKERLAAQQALYQQLSDEYTKFMMLVLNNADLRLLRASGKTLELKLTEEQAERQLALFSILVAIFERAYLLVYEETMEPQTRRMWQSWEDFMRDWCKRADFRAALPELLNGEDEQFAEHIAKIAQEIDPAFKRLS